MATLLIQQVNKKSLVLLCCNLIGSKQFVISSNATEKK